MLPCLMDDPAVWQAFMQLSPQTVYPVDYRDADRLTGMAGIAQHTAKHALSPYAELAVLEDPGHLVQMKRPKATRQVIKRFLSSWPNHDLNLSGNLC